MTRTRLAAAALSAAVVGLTLSLAPAVSIAAPDTGVRPATPTVEWADSGADFATLDPRNPVLPEGWSWWAGQDPDEDVSLEDVVDFGADGVANNGTEPLVALFHGSSEPLAPSALPELVDDASVEIGARASFSLLATQVESGDTLANSIGVTAVDGVNGADTRWTFGPNEPVDTPTLAQQLEDQGYVIDGYALLLGDGFTPPAEPTEPEVPVDPQDPPVLLLSELAEVSALADEETPSSAVAAAAAPIEGAASVRFADLTTYFTPQPSSVLTLATTSVTAAQATTVGIPFSASGFAPGETVTVGLSAGQSGNEVPDVSFVADAAGAVSGTVVLPADLATVGSFSLVLIGSSSGQAAFAAFEITSGAAPVAVPVPAPATFAG